MKKSIILVALALLFSSQVSIAQCSRTGNFVQNAADTPTSGSVSLVFQTNGTKQIQLGTNFSTTPGPDIHVILCKNATYNKTNDIVISGLLIQTNGAQTFNVPSNVDINQFKYVLIHCIAYNHRFGYAVLGNPIGPDCPTLGVNDVDVDSNSIQIFPNPTDDILNFTVEDETEVSIYDLSGKKINSDAVLTKENNLLSIQSQPNGIYLVEINSNNKKTTKKIIKK